ncbi:MAG: ABC transporter ATP-binding protein [bacterium]|nr:ABC transporter ATP-binding protein [bacterium]
MENIITIKDLNFTYHDGHRALIDVNLDIRKGEAFGIIGPTGAGKSTLLQHLNGILKGEGEVYVDNIKIDKKNDALIKEKVGVVFQNPDDQLFCPTVYEDIAFGLFNLGFKAGEIDRKVDDILEKMNLSHMKELSSHHLSFGEKKRVALATTLVMNPQVLALDEPFANLDYKSIMNVIEMIKELSLTRVIISQDILLALSICDRIALLDKGKIVKVASPEEIASDHETLSRSGLDFAPYLEIIKKFL